MDESPDLNSIGELATQDQAETHMPEVQQQEQALQDGSRNDRNWRAANERRKELERELRFQREQNERLVQQMTSQTKPVEPDELDQVSDDDYIPKGKVKKLVQREREALKKEAVQEVERILEQREQGRFVERLKAKFSDFDEIVNPDTIALLEEQEPELAIAISASNDPYKMGIQSYKYIKALGLSAKAPEKRRVNEVEKKLEKNAKTFPSPISNDKRPIATAFKMTASEKTELYKEMMGYAAMTGGY